MMLSSGSDIYAVSKQLGHDDIGTTQIYCNLASKARVREVNRLPTLSEPSAVAISPVMIVSSQEQINQPELVITPKAGSIAEALQAKGEKVAAALSLRQNAAGKYEFNGQHYTAAELAMEV